MERVRRCTNWRPLWGENLAVLVGDLLQALLKSDAGQLARLRFSFQFQLLQGGRTRVFLFHPFPFIRGLSLSLG
jgi:hypothetical protein